MKGLLEVKRGHRFLWDEQSVPSAGSRCKKWKLGDLGKDGGGVRTAVREDGLEVAVELSLYGVGGAVCVCLLGLQGKGCRDGQALLPVFLQTFLRCYRRCRT